MKYAIPFLFVAISAMNCRSHSVHAAEAAAPQTRSSSTNDVRISPEITWQQGELNGQPTAYLDVSLIAQGGSAASAIAYGDLKVDSIKDENDQFVKPAQLTHDAGMLLVQVDPSAKHPKDGVRMSIKLFDPPPFKKLSELRGSFGLQTGGRLQEVVVKDAFTQNGRVIDDATLKALGITVRMKRTTRQRPTEATTESASSITPGNADEAQDVLEFDVNNGEKTAAGGYSYPAQHAQREYELAQRESKHDTRTSGTNSVVRLEIIDPKGKSFAPAAFEFGNSITKATFCFKDGLPAGSQLHLMIHRDAKTIRVPYMLKDIEVPPKRKSSENQTVTPATQTFTPTTTVP